MDPKALRSVCPGERVLINSQRDCCMTGSKVKEGLAFSWTSASVKFSVGFLLLDIQQIDLQNSVRPLSACLSARAQT